jgi:hypothetical protein
MDKSMISGKSSGAADVCRSAPGNQGEGATARCLAVSDRSVLQSILPLKIPPDNPRDRKNRVRLTMVSAAWLAMALLLSATLTWGEGLGPEDKAAAENSALTPASGADQQSVTLPGILLNLQERCVDVESVVCLEEGTLELVACTKGSKEHESIVAIGAKPVHVHTALLLLGAESGNPAMRQMVDDAEPRWIHLPPRGDPVAVSLVCADLEKLVERPISEFITRTAGNSERRLGEEEETGKGRKFQTDTFLFSGSQLRGEGEGPRRYLSDLSGNVISLATFGDELLCLPGVYGHENGALMWQVDSTHLPAVGTKITLRLRPQIKRAPKVTQDGKSTPGKGQP